MMVNSNVDEMIVNETAAKALKVAVDHCKAAELALKDAEFKYHKLVKFRQDYVERFDNEMKHYVAEETQQGFRSFFSRLDVVIFEQQEMVAGLQRTVNIQRELVQECQKREQLMDA